MTDAAIPPDLSPREQLAAEHALRLLEGGQAVKARGLVASDPEFAALVAQWEVKFAPMLDGVTPAEPGPELWARIESEIERQPGSADITSLQTQVRRWRWASAGMAAAAVVAIALLAGPLVGPTSQPSPASPALAQADDPLVASIPIADTALRIGVTYLPDRAELLVSASGLEADGVHDHELWLVPREGAPQSLGVVAPGREARVSVDSALAERIGDGSDLILTREPLGGAPAGGDAGPVVAEGRFSPV